MRMWIDVMFSTLLLRRFCHPLASISSSFIVSGLTNSLRWATVTLGSTVVAVGGGEVSARGLFAVLAFAVGPLAAGVGAVAVGSGVWLDACGVGSQFSMRIVNTAKQRY